MWGRAALICARVGKLIGCLSQLFARRQGRSRGRWGEWKGPARGGWTGAGGLCAAAGAGHFGQPSAPSAPHLPRWCPATAPFCPEVPRKSGPARGAVGNPRQSPTIPGSVSGILFAYYQQLNGNPRHPRQKSTPLASVCENLPPASRTGNTVSHLYIKKVFYSPPSRE